MTKEILSACINKVRIAKSKQDVLMAGKVFNYIQSGPLRVDAYDGALDWAKSQQG
jgi:hypothetical protein